MKIKFSTKLFFTFLLFSGVLLLSLAYYEYKIIKKKAKENSIKSFNVKIELLNKKIKDKKIENENIIDSIINLNSFNIMDKLELSKNLKVIISSHMKLLDISIYDRNYNNLLNVSKNNKVQKNDYFDFLSKLNNRNQLLISEIDLEKYNEDIIYPLVHTIKIAKKVDNYIVVLNININDLADVLKSFSYILDKNYDVIYDKTNKYTWSKYYYPNYNMEDILPFIKFLDYKKYLD